MIIYHRPWFWWILKLRFKMKWKDVAIASGDTIYTPKKLEGYLIEHELVHIRQMKEVRFWWIKYLLSKKFRFRMELEAYRRQYDMLGTPEWREHIAGILSGPVYGYMVSKERAYDLLEK